MGSSTRREVPPCVTRQASARQPASCSWLEFFRRSSDSEEKRRFCSDLPGWEGGSRPLPVRRGESTGFRVVARIKVGKNPHQIAFTADGQTAYVAAAGSGRVTRVDARSRHVLSMLDVPFVPLGVAVPPSGSELLVSCFGADRVLRFRLGEKQASGHLATGGAPSLLVGPYPGRKYLVSAEKADRLWVLDAERFALEADDPTGS